MKRDMDLCRKILIEVENAPTPAFRTKLKLDGYSQEDISYNVMLLSQAGLLTAVNFGGDDRSNWKPESLTWEGHEFLDAARDNKRWEKAKTAMAQAGGFALDVMKQLLVQYLKAELELS